MRRAHLLGVPFWPASSILDMPSIIFAWQDIAAEAEAKAQPEIDRQRKIMAAQATAAPTPMRRLG